MQKLTIYDFLLKNERLQFWYQKSRQHNVRLKMFCIDKSYTKIRNDFSPLVN